MIGLALPETARVYTKLESSSKEDRMPDSAADLGGSSIDTNQVANAPVITFRMSDVVLRWSQLRAIAQHSAEELPSCAFSIAMPGERSGRACSVPVSRGRSGLLNREPLE